MEKPSGQEVTALLQEWSAGDRGALERLMPLVYAELRKLAASHLKSERDNHTLQATALVHEAYLRLVGQLPELVVDERHEPFEGAAISGTPFPQESRNFLSRRLFHECPGPGLARIKPQLR